MDKAKRDELRQVVKDTPGECRHWPDVFMGCIPHVTVYTPDMPRLEFQVQGIDKWGPVYEADRAIKYAHRLAASANTLPELLDAVDSLEAKVERLTKALQPFAKMAERFDSNERDEEVAWLRYDAHTQDKVTLGDFRNARAALKEGTL